LASALGKLTTHVLDTAHGVPAAGVAVRLSCADGSLLAEAITNADGRCDRPLLEGEALRAGRYVLDFAMADYFRARRVTLPEPPFLDHVVIAFAIADSAASYHIPLLVSPFGYSTYRGS
jgi:5-hydroxyisourate hydrolase